MNPRRLARALSVLLTLGTAALAHADLVQPRLVRVRLSAGLTVAKLLEAGLDVIEVKGTSEAKLLEWPGDEIKLSGLSATAEVVDASPGRSAALRSQSELASQPRPSPTRVRSAVGPDGVFRIESLPPFGSGSMGGYWTLAEIKMKLDALVANDTHDLVADKVDTIGTSASHRWPIWGLKITKHVPDPDTRPVVFFNAITHAREPEGMQALFYFVDDILSKYGTDPFATYLLDHRVLYIVPCVNPDGYEVNQNTYFSTSSFGFWRKNIRDNNGNMSFDNNDGVDINRNYGYRWGKDNVGSSGSQSSDIYRGPSAFSELETTVQRDKIVALHPVTGLSFHTYQDLMLHAWGNTDSLPPDWSAFHEWNDLLTRDNAYQSGQPPKILYTVNGEFNDWCYGDTIAKPRAFTWTPEIGSDDDGFWPPPSRIVPLAAENLRTCYVVTALAGPFVQQDGVTIQEGALNATYHAHLSVRARNLGATGVAGPGLTGTLVPLDPGVQMITSSVSYPDLGSRQSGDPVGGAKFDMVVADSVTPGRLMRFQIDFTTPGGLFSRDTLVLPLGTPTLVASDNASNGLGQWSPGSWGIVSNDPQHPSRYFADSPGADYALGANNIMLLNAPLNLSAGVHAYALYEAHWDLEKNYDAAEIEASLDGSTWTRLHATGTTPGSGVSGGLQTLGEPFYAGTRWLWKSELADLSAFTGPAGNAVRLRYRLQSDGSAQFDGFNFDSLRIVVYDPAAQPGPSAVGDGTPPLALGLASPSPNPMRTFGRFSFTLPRAGRVRLEVLDVQGRRVATLADGAMSASRYVRGWDVRDDEGRAVPPGMYLARLSGVLGSVTRRFVVLK